MSQPVRWVLGLFLVALLVGGPLGYASYRQSHFRTCGWSNPACFTAAGR